MLSLAAIFLVISRDWQRCLGACFALAAATLLFIFYIQPDASDLAPHRSKLDQLMERRDTIYDNLRDLRFEYRAGKYSEGDLRSDEKFDGDGSRDGAGRNRSGNRGRCQAAAEARAAPANEAPDEAMLRFCRGACVFVLLFAAASRAATVHGTVNNGTTGKPAGGRRSDPDSVAGRHAAGRQHQDRRVRAIHL